MSPSGAVGPRRPATENPKACNLRPPEMRNIRPALTRGGAWGGAALRLGSQGQRQLFPAPFHQRAQAAWRGEVGEYGHD